MGTDSDFMEIEIIENPNPQKEPVIDLTNLEDENKLNTGEQDEPNCEQEHS